MNIVKIPAIMCDIDGTLALKGDRPFNDYDRVGEDDICNPVKEVLVKFSETHHIILISGRENKRYCRSITEYWLKAYNVPYNDLFMREFKDFRPDDQVKKEIFEKFVKPFYDVLFVIDDRDKVVRMWRDIGVTCFQCAYGDF